MSRLPSHQLTVLPVRFLQCPKLHSIGSDKGIVEGVAEAEASSRRLFASAVSVQGLPSTRSAQHVIPRQRHKRLSALRQDCLALGVIFAATDSVAVLQARPARAPPGGWAAPSPPLPRLPCACEPRLTRPARRAQTAAAQRRQPRLLGWKPGHWRVADRQQPARLAGAGRSWERARMPAAHGGQAAAARRARRCCARTARRCCTRWCSARASSTTRPRSRCCAPCRRANPYPKPGPAAAPRPWGADRSGAGAAAGRTRLRAGTARCPRALVAAARRGPAGTARIGRAAASAGSGIALTVMCRFLPACGAGLAGYGVPGQAPSAQELGSGGRALRASMIVTVLAKFLYLFAASMCLGLAFGLGTSFLMKTFRSNSVPQARARPPRPPDAADSGRALVRSRMLSNACAWAHPPPEEACYSPQWRRHLARPYTVLVKNLLRLTVLRRGRPGSRGRPWSAPDRPAAVHDPEIV